MYVDFVYTCLHMCIVMLWYFISPVYVLVSFPRSLSYILLLGGFGYFVLAVFYLIIDVFPFWSGAPFKYPGT